MLLLYLFVCVRIGFAANDKIAALLIHKGTNGTTGPSEEWIQQVSQRAQQYAIQTSKSGNIKAVQPTDLETIISQFRAHLGPKSNKSSTAKAESPDVLKDFALQGDMILNPDQWDQFLKKGTPKSKRAVTTDLSLLWTIGTPIPYAIDASLASIADKIRSGIQFWADNSCLTFVESQTALPRLHYYNGTGCWSYIGKQSSFGAQDISIGVGCDSHGTICHETAHAMGFYHTQSRYDRDDYLNVYYSNIEASETYNFVEQTPATETHFNLPFDYGSVMEYDPYAFAINTNLPTLAAKDLNYQNAMGQREAPSFSDVMEMNLLYKCASYCSTPPACQNNGIVNPNTCSDCLCPRYYSGSFCQDLNPGTAPVCNGKIVQTTSTTVTSLNATIGLGITNNYQDVDIPADCYWMIQGPAGSTLQLQITYLSTSCMERCPWGAFEINLGNINQYGMVLCCSTIYSTTFTTVSNFAMIRGYSRYNNINMMINYRVA